MMFGILALTVTNTQSYQLCMWVPLSVFRLSLKYLGKRPYGNKRNKDLLA